MADTGPFIAYSSPEEKTLSVQDQARQLVVDYYNGQLGEDLNFPPEEGEKWPQKKLTIDEVYVVWSAKILQNWKALVSTARRDGLYYEVTRNGDKGEIYIDAYGKIDNHVVVDPPIPSSAHHLTDN